MTHIILHVLVPLLIALVCYRRRWSNALLIMLATMVVDTDHLLADPIYVPERCSIGFHPLHSVTAISVYTALFVLSAVAACAGRRHATVSAAHSLHLIGLGLLVHMALDWIDCAV